MSELTRKIVFKPAFDKRNPDPAKNYGIHGLGMQFQLIGPDGGVTYTIRTNWMLPHVQEEIDAKPLLEPAHFRYLFHKPMSAGLDGHWKKPLYEDQSPIDNCLITGGECYCDETSLTTNVFNRFVAEGDSAIWEILEERYESWRPK